MVRSCTQNWSFNIIVGLKRLEQNVAREECHHYRKTSAHVHVLIRGSGASLTMRWKNSAERRWVDVRKEKKKNKPHTLPSKRSESHRGETRGQSEEPRGTRGDSPLSPCSS